MLYNSLNADDYHRSGPFNAEYDEYPFDTNLSVLKVTEEAEEEREERKMSLLRKYNQRLLDYDEKNLEKVNGPDRSNEYYKRYQYAVKTLKPLKRKRTKNRGM